MDLTKYLYTPDYNPNTPKFIIDQGIRPLVQDNRDQIYLHGSGGVENWLGQAQSWIDRNALNRIHWVQAGNDPQAFQPDTFAMHAPSRTIADYTDGGVPNWHDDTAENSPTLAALFPHPVLPAYVADPGGNGGITGHPPGSVTKDIQQAVQDAMVLAGLKDIQTRLTAIEQKLGIGA